VADLPDVRRLNWTNRYQAEAWIGLGDDWNPASCFRTGSFYEARVTPDDYAGHVGCGWHVPLDQPMFPERGSGDERGGGSLTASQ
jgi:hypothetical protein